MIAGDGDLAAEHLPARAWAWTMRYRYGQRALATITRTTAMEKMASALDRDPRPWVAVIFSPQLEAAGPIRSWSLFRPSESDFSLNGFGTLTVGMRRRFGLPYGILRETAFRNDLVRTAAATHCARRAWDRCRRRGLRGWRWRPERRRATGGNGG